MVVEESATEAHTTAVLIDQQQPDIGVVGFRIAEGHVGYGDKRSAGQEHAKFARRREIAAGRMVGEEVRHHLIGGFRAGFQQDEVGGAIIEVAHGGSVGWDQRSDSKGLWICLQGRRFLRS